MPEAAVSNHEVIGQYAVHLADDALILGHQLSQWCGRGPFLEEDLALTNVALDYLGRARMYYGYAAELSAGKHTENDFAYRRDCREFTNLLIYELPRGDFAFTLARQFLVDAYDVAFTAQLESSADHILAAIAAKAHKESRYHLRRSRDWMLRLGDGTAESHTRLQSAVNELWGYTPELFEMDSQTLLLAEADIAVNVADLHPGWERLVRSTLAGVKVTIPEADWQVGGGRRGLHTEWLGHALSELQFVQRAYPGLEW